MNKEKQALEQVQAALEALGFRIQAHDWRLPSGKRRVDLVAQRGGDRFWVELKAQAPFRKKEFRGAIADSILQLREAVAEEAARPLLAMWLQKRSPAALEEMQEYIGRFAPGMDWLLVDAHGWRRWQIGGESGESPGRAGWRDIRAAWAQAPADPFSPLNQWLLKVLLLPGLDRRWWGGPEQLPSGVSELARLAAGSQSQASKLVGSLRQLGYLGDVDGGFRFRDLPRLLQDWAVAVRSRPDRIQFAGPVYPEASAEGARERLMEKLAKLAAEWRPDRAPPPPVVGSLAACRFLGLARSNVEHLRLYVHEPAPDALERLELVPADPGSALCEIVQPRVLQSVFAGAVKARQGWVCDVLQCYLDVSSSAARGQEQADFLLDRVLMPHFEERGWF